MSGTSNAMAAEEAEETQIRQVFQRTRHSIARLRLQHIYAWKRVS